MMIYIMNIKNFLIHMIKEITKKDYSKIHICLLNIPCAGFGDRH